MSNKIVARIEGEVTYSDGSSASFASMLDDDDTVSSDGISTAMGDVISTVKALFTALGGTLTCAPATSGKTVRDKTALISISGSYGATEGSELPFSCYAEYTSKIGTTISNGGAAAYSIAKTRFNSRLKSMVQEIAGVSATIA